MSTSSYSVMKINKSKISQAFDLLKMAAEDSKPFESIAKVQAMKTVGDCFGNLSIVDAEKKIKRFDTGGLMRMISENGSNDLDQDTVDNLLDMTRCSREQAARFDTSSVSSLLETDENEDEDDLFGYVNDNCGAPMACKVESTAYENFSKIDANVYAVINENSNAEYDSDTEVFDQEIIYKISKRAPIQSKPRDTLDFKCYCDWHE